MIDACVHPNFPRPDDINAYMPREYRNLRLAKPLAGPYPLPIGKYVAGSTPAVTYRPPRSGGLDPGTLTHAHAATTFDGVLPGSDPLTLEKELLENSRAEYVVLVPLTRGLVADPELDAAIASATNEWMAETWLNEFNTHGRYRGSIRISPRNVSHAIDEIARWASNPLFVQVAVPLETRALYGEEMYFAIWEAAASHDLPILIQSDDSGGVLAPPTAVGYPMFALEHYAQRPVQSVTHLASLIGHGVFDRLPNLRVVFADGGYDFMCTLMWRVDGDWRATRAEVPWISHAPSRYLERHVRFIIRATDGSTDRGEFNRFIELNELSTILLYGSNYPFWDYLPPVDLIESLPEDSVERVMHENAQMLYQLPSVVDTATRVDGA